MPGGIRLSPAPGAAASLVELIDLEERVVVVICDYARREPDGPEVTLR